MNASAFRWLMAIGVGCFVIGTALGQEKKVDAKKPIVRQLTITVGSTVRVQMTTKRPILTVFNENEHILRVSPLRDDPTTVLVTGLTPGITRIHLTDIDGKTEVLGPGKPKDKK